MLLIYLIHISGLCFIENCGTKVEFWLIDYDVCHLQTCHMKPFYDSSSCICLPTVQSQMGMVSHESLKNLDNVETTVVVLLLIL